MSKKKTLYIIIKNQRVRDNIVSCLKGYNLCIKEEFSSVVEDILENKIKLIIFDTNSLSEYITFCREYTTKLPHIVYAVILINYENTSSIDLTNFEEYNIFAILDVFKDKSIDKERLILTINNAVTFISYKEQARLYSKKYEDYKLTLGTLNEIGLLLSTEKDLDSLLYKILQKIRELTNSDGGSIYILEEGDSLTLEERNKAILMGESVNKNLVFKILQNDSKKLDYHQHKVPINRKSLAGFVALEAKILNIADAYNISKDAEYTINKDFDKATGYKTKSILVIPMKNHKDEVIGVIQLINRKKNKNIKLNNAEDVEKYVIPYDEEIESYAMSVASQSAIAIENLQLINSINNLFEGFVTASVSAIEQRDPSTKGHSERVAKLSVAIAKAINDAKEGVFKDISFSDDEILEIKYAGLLHDFGKVGVRESVLVKAKKLYEWNIELIKERYGFIKEYIKNRYFNYKIKLIANDSPSEVSQEYKYWVKLDKDLSRKLRRLNEYFEFILEKSNPCLLTDSEVRKINHIASVRFIDYEGRIRNLLNEQERENLTIKKGTLNKEERKEIEAHSTHTYNFLVKIPWTKNLKEVPSIAYSHHEKLNGEGYPLGLKANEIPFQSKILAVADIFDALTASDRPYKFAIPLEQALDILDMEVEANHIDRDIVELFKKEKVYKVLQSEEQDNYST